MIKNTVEYLGKHYVNLGDFHTHTVYSMHGMSSPEEMVRGADRSHLKYIGITDHHYPFKASKNYNDPMYFTMKNQEARMWEYSRSFEDWGIKVIPGYEYNLFVREDDCNIIHPHMRLIGLHSWHCYINELTPNELLSDIESHLSTKRYNIFAHPEREIHRMRYNNSEETEISSLLSNIVQLCKQYDVIIEVNESSIVAYGQYYLAGNAERMKIWLLEAKSANMPIIVNTDSHVSTSIGHADFAFELLESLDYPTDLIINFDKDKIEDLIVNNLK